MLRWRTALLAGILAGSVTLFFGFWADRCTLTTLLIRTLVSLFFFAGLGFLAGWWLDRLISEQQVQAEKTVKSVGLSVDIKSEPSDQSDAVSAEEGFQPLSAEALGAVTGRKRE